MTFLPIVDRELRTAARSPAMYRNRSLVTAVVAVVALVMMLFSLGFSSPSQIGQAMFSTLRTLTFLCCLLEGLRKTADCLSEERREGTLGLLFLTDLKSYDIILGKLAATSLTSFYGLLAILPILALPLMAGGVTQGEFWRTTLALINVLFFSLCTGMWISSRSRIARQAIAGTFWAQLLLLVIPLCIPFSVVPQFSPGYAFFHSSDYQYGTGAGAYWQSLGFTQIIAWGLLALASFNAARFAQMEAALANPRARRQKGKSKPFVPVSRKATERDLLEINPFLWLATRSVGSSASIWLYTILIITAAVGVVAFSLIESSSGPYLFMTAAFFILPINLLLKIRVGAQACRCMAEARENHALEMLLCTPLKQEDIFQGQVLALKKLHGKPLLLILAAEITIWVAGLIVLGSSRNMMIGGAVSAIFGAAYLGIAALDFVAVSWAGMWFGLTSKNETQAVFRTVFYVLIAPAFTFFCGWFIPLALVWPIICIAWAKQKLRAEFRSFALQQYAPVRENTKWWSTRNYQRPGGLQPVIAPPVVQQKTNLATPPPFEKKEGGS